MMSQRSSGPGRHRTIQQEKGSFTDGQSTLRVEKGASNKFPPIQSDTFGMTGKLGLPSSRPHPVAVTSRLPSEFDKSKALQRTAHKDTSGKSHTRGPSWQRGASPTLPRKVKRSEIDSTPAHSGHRRSSSTSKLVHTAPWCELQASSETPPFRSRHVNHRQTGSPDMWNGSGSDPIAHRNAGNTINSAKKQSTRSVKRSDGRSALVQSALNGSPAGDRKSLFQQETATPSKVSQDKHAHKFDTLTNQRTRDTSYSSSPRNANNNSCAGGSPHPPPHCGNGEIHQSYILSSTLHEGLSGGGPRHSKYTNTKVGGIGIQSDALRASGTTGVSPRAFSPHKVHMYTWSFLSLCL